jgi:flagellar biosynthesis protein FlhF
MTINKFQGNTKEEAIDKAKQGMGPNAVIMNVKEIKPKGFFAVFRRSTYEATAALEEKDDTVQSFPTIQSSQVLHDNINVAADERIEFPKPVRSQEISYTASSGANSGESPGAATRSSYMRTEVPVSRGSYVPQETSASRGSYMSQDASITRSSYFTADVLSPRNPNILPEEPEAVPEAEDRSIGKRLDDLSGMIDEKLGGAVKENISEKVLDSEELNYVRIIYRTLLENEVNEHYANQVIDEVERFLRPGNSVDIILANVYQKLILRFGRPNTIELGKKKPKILFFIGPTGVGKTTTIAKLASKCKVESNYKVAFITADTYRIAATEQLRVYADILEAPMSIVYSPEDMNDAISKLMDYDLIFVDTAGFSHKNESQRTDMKRMIDGLSQEYEKEVYLVLSATTKYHDLLEIVDIYRGISSFKLIFTKLDETTTLGNILNIKLYSGADLSYVTNGQNVPADLEVFNTQKIVKQLLGGK